MKKIVQKKSNSKFRYSMVMGFVLITALGVVSSYSSVSSAEASKPPLVSMVPESFTDLAKDSSPAVVNISTVKTVKNEGQVFRHFFGEAPGAHGTRMIRLTSFLNIFLIMFRSRNLRKPAWGPVLLLKRTDISLPITMSSQMRIKSR